MPASNRQQVKAWYSGRSKGDGLDYFPTPPWATRALFTLPLKIEGSVLEPACGGGHMSQVLEEQGLAVAKADITHYGWDHHTEDFLKTKRRVDWVITNPPFNKAMEFTLKARAITRKGIAFFLRMNFIESKKRYTTLFSKYPPSTIYVFSERIHMNYAKVAKTGSCATPYAWFIWEKPISGKTELVWIPPCKAELEKDEDYR